MKKDKKNNYLVIFLLIISLAVFIFALLYSPKPKMQEEIRTGKKIKVTTTIFPIYDIIKQIGGDRVEAISLLPPGASPHTFEPTPEVVKDITDTNLFFFVGAGADTWATFLVQDNINQARADYMAIDLSTVVELMPFNESLGDSKSEEAEDEHEEGEFDPHYWLSPSNALVIAREVAADLSRIDEENREYYSSNFEAFKEELESRINSWNIKMGEIENKKIVVFHDAWYYFASFFGLEIVGSFEPYPGKTPSPKYLQAVQTVIADNNISTIFTEPQLSAELATSMAQDVASKVEVLDPLGGVEGRDSYIKLIDYNVETIYSSLK